MSRWEPNTRGRLEQAALDLFVDRGFDQTTVTEIATRAGLTERTFYRHFTDKREVLFGQGELRDHLVEALKNTPATTNPAEAVIEAFETVAAEFFTRHEHSQRRNTVIAANEELQERELLKLATISTALATVLRDRGTAPHTANLAAETGIATFRVAFRRWIEAANPQDFATVVRETFNELKALVTGT